MLFRSAVTGRCSNRLNYSPPLKTEGLGACVVAVPACLPTGSVSNVTGPSVNGVCRRHSGAITSTRQHAIGPMAHGALQPLHAQSVPHGGQPSRPAFNALLRSRTQGPLAAPEGLFSADRPAERRACQPSGVP